MHVQATGVSRARIRARGVSVASVLLQTSVYLFFDNVVVVQIFIFFRQLCRLLPCEVFMELKAYSIRDSKGEIFNSPFYSRSHGEAERSFHQLVNDPQSQVSKYPEDYDLYFVGVFDDQTGKFTPEATPSHLMKAVNVKQTVQ